VKTVHTPPAAISRRVFLANASLAALALHQRNLFAQTAPAVVRTPLGALRGEAADNVRIFRGIPFAEPPIGPLRFRAPVKIKPWQGERDATKFPAAAPQPGAVQIPQSEDCLALNLWAPEGKGLFPVFIWIHGGGFTGGHAFDPLYDGAEFAREGILCITVPYRLGVFGFLDLEPLLGADYTGSANNALRDLITALQWVQANVASFGGDPKRVTIGGESAGAKLTDILMGIPSAQPLFHQMISESGGAERIWPKSNSALIANGYGDQWRNLKKNDIASLCTAAPMLLIEAQQRFIAGWPQHFPLRAEVDGVLIPRLPVETIAAGSTRGKRLLIGTNLDESAAFIGPHPSKDAIAADLGNLPLPRFAEVYPRYKAIYPDLTEEQRRIRAVTAEEYWVPSTHVVDAHVKAGGSAWMYRLDFAETSGRLQGYAYHGLDEPLVWDKPRTSGTNAAAEITLAKQMHPAWSAFIRGESPAAPGLPAWPPYRSDTRPTMVLDTQSRVDQKPHEAELRLWDGVL